MALAQGHIKENRTCVLLFTVPTWLRQSLVLTKDTSQQSWDYEATPAPALTRCSLPQLAGNGQSAGLWHQQATEAQKTQWLWAQKLPSKEGTTLLCCNNHSEKGHDTNALPERRRPAGEGRRGTVLLKSRWNSMACSQRRIVPPGVRPCNVVLQQRRTSPAADTSQGARDSLKGSSWCLNSGGGSRTGPQARSGYGDRVGAWGNRLPCVCLTAVVLTRR